jgi:hypothetical protein
LITRIIFGEQYRSWSFSLCSLLYSLYLTLLRPEHLPEHPIFEHNIILLHYYKSEIRVHGCVNFVHWKSTSRRFSSVSPVSIPPTARLLIGDHAEYTIFIHKNHCQSMIRRRVAMFSLESFSLWIMATVPCLQ